VNLLSQFTTVYNKGTFLINPDEKKSYDNVFVLIMLPYTLQRFSLTACLKGLKALYKLSLEFFC